MRLSVDVVSLISAITLAVVSTAVVVVMGLLVIRVLVMVEGSLDEVAITESLTMDTGSADVDVGTMSDEAAVCTSLTKAI